MHDGRSVQSADVLAQVSLGLFVENIGAFSAGRHTVAAAPDAYRVNALVGYGFEMIGLGAAIQSMWLAAGELGLAGVFMGDVLIAEDAIRERLASTATSSACWHSATRPAGRRPSRSQTVASCVTDAKADTGGGTPAHRSTPVQCDLTDAAGSGRCATRLHAAGRCAVIRVQLEPQRASTRGIRSSSASLILWPRRSAGHHWRLAMRPSEDWQYETVVRLTTDLTRGRFGDVHWAEDAAQETAVRVFCAGMLGTPYTPLAEPSTCAGARRGPGRVLASAPGGL